jgi:hypothetical protein
MLNLVLKYGILATDNTDFTGSKKKKATEDTEE